MNKKERKDHRLKTDATEEPVLREVGHLKGCGMPMPPDDGDVIADVNMNSVPFARPVEVASPGEPDGDDGLLVPIGTARPVQRVAMPMSRLRALGELLCVLVSGFTVMMVLMIATDRVVLPDPRWREVIVTGCTAAVVVLICLTLVRLNGHRLCTIGWRTSGVTVDTGIAVAALSLTYALLLVGGMIAVVFDPSLTEGPTKAQEAIRATLPPLSLPAILLMMLGVALWEEIVFRGFLLTRLHAIFRRWWLAVPLGAMLFASGHVYEGALAVGVIVGLGLVMGGLFAWRKSLLPSVVYHMLFNTVAMLMLRHLSPT